MKQMSSGLLESVWGWTFPFIQSHPVMVTVMGFLCSVLAIVLYYFNTTLSHIPGPWLSKVSALQIGLYNFFYRRNEYILEWHKRYGPVICVGPNEVSVATLEGTKQIYGTSLRWPKSDYFDHFKGYGMRSAFATKDYKGHQKKRKLISAFYQSSNIYKMAEIEQHIQNRCRAVLKTIQHGREVDVYCLTDWYAFDIITFLTFGPDFGSRSVESPCTERDILAGLKKLQFVGPFRTLFPTTYDLLSPLLNRLSPRLKYLSADVDLASWCKQRIAAAMNDARTYNTSSLLRRLLETQDFNGEDGPLDRQYVAAEILDNIGAAEATVAVTATYLLWRLAENPEWQRKLRKELAELPVSADGSIEFAEIDTRAPSLEACLREVYRLHPASSGRAERVVPQDGYVLSNVYIPPGTIVVTSVLALHRDEALFPDPDEFRPERWFDADPEVLKLREAQLIPFGYGGRICLGKALATMEIKVLVASLCLQYEMTTGPSTTADSMWQSNTHDAVPKALECLIQFRKIAEED